MSVTTLDTLSNDTNDISIDEYGNIATRKNAEAMANIIYNVDKTNLGECPLDTSLGTDYFETIFGSPVDISNFKSQNISQTEKLTDVLGVSSFEYQISNEDNKNKLTYKKTTQTIYGEIKTNG